MMRHSFLHKLILSLFVGFSPAVFAGEHWGSELSPVAKDNQQWHLLLPALLQNNMDYGALAASARMLTFFTDLATKELAYKTIIDLVDEGYPFPTQRNYVAGDIEPMQHDNFSNSYNLYKGILNKDKGFAKWADYYFSKVDKDSFPKYQFYLALDAYKNGKFSEAEVILNKILKGDPGHGSLSFIKKVSRTLARIYFEKRDYKNALSIYTSFLLRVNPINPSDWLEAAWNYYYLEQYPEAIGVLYNLDSKAASKSINLEKYIIRSLIYKSWCRTENMDSLQKNFGTVFGRTIKAVKTGENLDNLRELDILDIPENSAYFNLIGTGKTLVRERKQISGLPQALQPLAKYLYDSEIGMLRRRVALYSWQARNRSAEYLINFHESLKFLVYAIAREKFNPDTVFSASDESKSKLVENLGSRKFRLYWRQRDDFWRDERVNYKGTVTDKCVK